VGSFKTADDRWLQLAMLQPGRYWPEFCQVVGRPELATDERFDTTEKIMGNAAEAAELVAEILASRTYAEWIETFEGMEGQWAAVQDAWDVGQDVSLRANGHIATVVDVDGKERNLVANPVQFDETPVSLTRAPEFAEHTDDVLRDLGLSDEELIQLKIEGAAT
jgi:crotonobetainyl-CoA:carnitine CoA-transferase CaiB-like acyl-CoA transferase